MASLQQLRSSKPVILAVDDTPINIDVLQESLRANYDVSIATDGPEALEILRAISPDLILLDIMMPGMNGFEVCQQIRSNPRLRDIPIIFLTAKSSPDDILEGFKAGAVDYLSKPFNVAELKARIGVHVELKRTREIVHQQNTEQKELLHVLCHDLANPLSNVLNALTLVREESDESFRMEYLDLMEKSVANGLDVIETVRSMRKLEEKSLQLKAVDLRQAVEDSVSLLYHIIANKKIHLVIDIDRCIRVMAEKTTLINSVLNNLLSNAVKFSKRGGKIQITAKTGRRTHNNTLPVTLVLRDFGIGIPESILNDIFDVTKTTSREGTEGESGTGFGMPLVAKFINAYGGTVSIESNCEGDPESVGTSVSLSFIGV